jgi:HEAT repeat protein
MEDYSIEHAIKYLSDPDPERRKGAAHRIADFKDRRAVAPLIAALDDTDPDVRALAARSLGALKDPQATELLLARLISDDNIIVKDASIDALGAIGDKRAINSLEKIVDAVDMEPILRARAILALGDIGHSPVGAKAITFLKDDGQTDFVYQASITVIGKFRLEVGVDVIEKFLSREPVDLDLVKETLLALRRIGSQSAKEAIERNLVHLSDFDREIAVRILETEFGLR